MNSESDIARLFAKFEENSGGTLSPQFSADLALEIVLNEIVEQARLATGATGAAVVLWRGQELVCRASNGASAPALGAHMDARSGLSGRCIQTGEVQRSNDTHQDPRADTEASRRLGVRSVLVLPLTCAAGVLGILEVLSTRPHAFSEQDQRTLEVLSWRVLKNVERAAEPLLLRADAMAPVVDASPARMSAEPPPYAAPPFVPTFGMPVEAPVDASAAQRRSDPVTWLMGLLLLAGMIVLGLLTARRMGWKSIFQTHAGKNSSPVVLQGPSPDGDSILTSASVLAADPPANAAGGRSGGAPANSTSAISDGGLRVYENGKEVFRLPAPRPEARRDTRFAETPTTVTEASLIHRVEPEYPEQARVKRLQGKVVLKVRLRPDGTVEDLQPLSGDPLLAQAAVKAVMQWRFKPMNNEDNPAAQMQTEVTLNFRLPQ